MSKRTKSYFGFYHSRKNHDSEKTIERSHGGPKDKVKEAGGLQIFHQQLPRVRRARAHNY
jgi:hypothetical protein